MITIPPRATTLASSVCGDTASRSQSQAIPAAANGCTATMMATLATLVSCSDGMKLTMPMAERPATSQPLAPSATSLRVPARPWVRITNSAIEPPPNSPRQNRMVQGSKCSSRVKNGAVLHAIAAATTSMMPARCCRSVDGIGDHFIAKAENALGLRKSGDRKFTEIDPVVTARAGEGGRCHHRPMQAARDLLEPGGKIDRRSDAGEVEAARTADIAEEDVADVQSQAETEVLHRVSVGVVHGANIGAGLAARFQHPAADLAQIAAIPCDRK